MVTRRIAALMLVLALAGCANSDNTTEAGAPAPGPSSFVPELPSPAPSTGPSAAKPTAGGAETITGTVTAGVEPNCLLVQDSKGAHLLVFDDTALRAQAKVGDRVTLSGTSKPGTMSTCQQGVPFLVTSVRPG